MGLSRIPIQEEGGSIRIPAALNGLVGFKPTARCVPLDGVLPLSFTLDSAFTWRQMRLKHSCAS
jgi:aspartyl-tRNA(Asn)/glutamyl-tRNA(Gln) amidotransferase subunit A